MAERFWGHYMLIFSDAIRRRHSSDEWSGTHPAEGWGTEGNYTEEQMRWLSDLFVTMDGKVLKRPSESRQL